MSFTYVYLLQSTSDPSKLYKGMTDQLDRRLNEHNWGQVASTAEFRPWEIICFIGFRDRSRAVAFERYLKSGSGHAFANKRLR